MFLLFLGSRHHDSLQRLAHLDIHLTAQGKYHRGNLLGHLHASLKILVYQTLVSYGEGIKMYAVLYAAKVLVELVGIERCERGHQLRDGQQTGVEGIVS